MNTYTITTMVPEFSQSVIEGHGFSLDAFSDCYIFTNIHFQEIFRINKALVISIHTKRPLQN